MTCKVLEIYVHVNSENFVYMFDNYVYTFASFPFFGHMYAKISIVHSQMCTIFLLSIYEIMIEIRKFIYAFIRNHFIIERSCNHWPINSTLYIFTIPAKKFLCHTCNFILYTCAPQFILYTYALTDVLNFFCFGHMRLW